MRNIKLVLEYDGLNFHGWQIQPNVRTVQGVLENTLSRLLQHEINLIGSGRTDTGVHAKAQVANFLTRSAFDLDKLKNALNGLLPADVVVLEIEEVSQKFNSRFDATFRHYKYVIGRKPSALKRNFQWFYPYKLDMEKIVEATNYLLGKHNFKAFCSTQSSVKNHFVTVREAFWHEEDDALIFDIIANRFLHGMVRSLVGTLIEIGRGKMKSEALKEILLSGDRSAIGPTAPPYGLYLVDVEY